MSKDSSVPSLDGVKWQKSLDGVTFKCIDITKPRYYGSSIKPKAPSLVIPKTTFEDAFHYRLFVWNKIGEHVSNTLRLNVTGSMYLFKMNNKTIDENIINVDVRIYIYIYINNL